MTRAGPPPAPSEPPPDEPADEPPAEPPADTLRPLPQLDHSIAPRKPRTVGGAVFLAVLATALLGVALVVAGHVQTGLSTAGAAFVAGAAARLVLPSSQAGMLGVRRKLIDVSTMLLLGIGLLVIAALIREPVA